jgi:hypothetical protein
LAIVSVTRLLVISDHEIPTALGLAASAGALSTLTGSIIPPLSVCLPLLAASLVAAIMFSVVIGAFILAMRLLAVCLVSVVAALLVTPTPVSMEIASTQIWSYTNNIWTILVAADGFPLFLIFVTIFIYAAWRTRQVARRQGAPGINQQWSVVQLRHLERAITSFIIGGLLLYVLTATVLVVYPIPAQLADLPATFGRMWLPAEIITTSDGVVRVGYVLSTGDDWATILVDSPRHLNIVPGDAVTSRTVCRTGGEPPGVPLISRISTGPTTITCPR